MKKLILILLILFIGISAVSASENVSNSNDMDIAIFDDVQQEDGSLLSEVNNDFESNSSSCQDNGDAVGVDNKSVIKDSSIAFKAKNLESYYKNKPVYKFKVVDSKGKPVSGLKVNVKFKGKWNNRISAKNGVVSFKLPEKVGKYSIKINYGNKTIKRTAILFKLKTYSKNIESIYGSRVNYKLRVLSNYGKPIVGVKVTFKVGKQVYNKKTNSKGFTSLPLNYDAGNYMIYYSVRGIHGKNKYAVKNRISLRIMNWGLKGDVSVVPLIRNNMPDSYWVKKAVEATKYGIPLLTIKGGSGKVVFMTAGVHGNEMPSQVAIMRIIDMLSKKPIKGTVYIIPFVNVKAINHQVRLTDYDYNRVAHVSGTVSNKIVNLIIKLKCDSYGDFHSTERPGVPGYNVILGYKSPATKCIDLTNYLSRTCNVPKIVYNYAGEVYRWSLADWVNSKGTPAVICEVISHVSTIKENTDILSFKMMYNFLKYNEII